MNAGDQIWAPQECTLPTGQRPVRLAEFDDLFARALLEQHRVSPTRLRWQLDPAVEAAARDLAARESACCSFFTFTFTAGSSGVAEGALLVDVDVPPAQVDVLDALAERARATVRR